MRGDYQHLGPQKAPPEGVRPLRVAVAVTPEFTLMALACFTDFLRLAGDESDFSRRVHCDWQLVSHDLAPVRSSCGFALTPTRIYGDPRDYDVVVVHGGLLHRDPPPAALYDFIRGAAAAGVVVAGNCSGSFVLAEAGLLGGRRCAVHFALAGPLRQRFPDILPITDQPLVRDGAILTCPGGLASLQLAMHLVSEAFGDTRAFKALHYLLDSEAADRKGLDLPDPGMQCPDRRVVNAIGLMRQKLYEPCSIAEIAVGVGTSERELSRLFQKHLRVAPSHHWRLMRLKAARWLVLNSDRSMAQIALECGFSDSAHLVNWFKRIYHITPARLRRTHREIGTR